MSNTVTTLLEAPSGFASVHVAHFMWQLDAQREQLLSLVKGATPEELAWQPAPGMNTIGMLLAHIAYAENHLVCVGVEGKSSSNTKATIGISVEEEGMPLADDAPPSAALDGKDLTFFREVLERARRYTRHALDPLTDADLQKVIVRERPDGNRREFNVGWVLYHLLEHEAGHRGQVALLRHLRRKT